MNTSCGSIIVVDGVLYPAGHSSILGILDMVYCTFLKYEIAMHHLRMATLTLLEFCLHFATWLLGLIVYANFGLLLD
jgi:hypothetical protein